MSAVDSPGAAQARARFFHSGDAFNLKLPPVPAGVFPYDAVRARQSRASGFVLCDQSGAFAAPFAATTPLMLARYAFIAASEMLAAEFAASGSIWYVIAGAGRATIAGDEPAFDWSAGDVFLAPGGARIALEAGAQGAVLWVVTNEPQLAFEGLRPAEPADRGIDAVHYPAAEIARQLARVIALPRDDTTAGCALIFSSERAESSRNIMPSLTLSLNTVPAGEHQRAHRHNSAAVTLILRGSRCYSLVGDRRCDWSPFATLVTPATEPHSHHNAGAERAAFLIVQDGGLHYHTRTMGFTFLEPDV
jgi:gentisate 1,2-dioxygenase